PLYSVIWTKTANAAKMLTPTFTGPERNYSGENYLGERQLDVRITPAAIQPTTQERDAHALERADKQLKAKPDDTQARFEKARALLCLGDNAKAAAEFSALIAKSPKVEESANWYDFRALANARLGKAKEAREDLAKFLEISPDAAEKAYV